MREILRKNLLMTRKYVSTNSHNIISFFLPWSNLIGWITECWKPKFVLLAMNRHIFCLNFCWSLNVCCLSEESKWSLSFLLQLIGWDSAVETEGTSLPIHPWFFLHLYLWKSFSDWNNWSIIIKGLGCTIVASDSRMLMRWQWQIHL